MYLLTYLFTCLEVWAESVTYRERNVDLLQSYLGPTCKLPVVNNESVPDPLVGRYKCCFKSFAAIVTPNFPALF